MTRLRWFFHRLTSTFRRRQRETDLDAELAFHLETEAASGEDEGQSAADAARAARRQFGNVARLREDARAVWGWRWIEDLGRDLRYAARILRRRPVFSVTTVLMLGLTIGATTALADLSYNLLLRPLPVDHPHELVRITRPAEPNGAETWATYEALHSRTTGFAGIAGMTHQFPRPIDVSVDDVPGTAQVQMVSGNYFDVLRARPSIGRLFDAAPAAAATEAVAVISHDYYQRHFRDDASPLGRTLRAYNIDFTIVGVTPAAFRGTDIDVPIDAWVPFERVVAPNDLDRTRGRWIQMVARLAPHVSPSEASAEVATLAGRPMVVHPGGTGFSALRERLAQPLLLLVLVVVVVASVTVSNLANLTLAGVAARAGELTVRQAIGAGRGRMARQLAAEGVVVIAGSLMLGGALAPAFSAALLSFLPPAQTSALPNLHFAFDGPAILCAVGTALAGLLVVGVLPVIGVLTGRRTAAPLHLAARGHSSHDRFRRPLLVGGIAACTVLLMTAGMFALTVRNLHAQDAGYVASALLVADVDTSPRSSTGDEWVQRLHVIRDRLADLPGVQAIGFSHTGQLSGVSINGSVRIPGRPEPASTDSIEHRVSPGFLPAMGARLLAGRGLLDTDDATAPRVAVVTEAFAHRYFGTTDVVGRAFLRQSVSGVVDTTTIVGLTANGKWHTLREESPVMYFVPYRQHDSSSVTFAIRSTGSLAALAAQVPAVVSAVDPGMVTSDVVPFTDVVNRTLVVERLVAHVATALAGFGVLVACVGLYGILAFAVVRRTREIGVRMALGARPRAVEWLFLGDTLGLLVAGLAIGLPAAYVVARSSSSLLFGLEPGDLRVTTGVAAILTVTALAASWIPARRAARIEPMDALRDE